MVLLSLRLGRQLVSPWARYRQGGATSNSQAPQAQMTLSHTIPLHDLTSSCPRFPHELRTSSSYNPPQSQPPNPNPSHLVKSYILSFQTELSLHIFPGSP
ncbi:unnamed protein product [Peniophora sp. CBMAI 1063]|nr:unnamed protein product [Peniophora sp. CBMAI 1063]